MPGAIFFDFDGTLADTRADLAATVNHTRRDFDLPPLAVDTIMSFVGNGAKKLLARSIPELKDPPLDVFMSHYLEHATESVRLYPGVVETLDELRSAGWRLGLNTAKPRAAVDLILAQLGIGGFFGPAVIAGGDCRELKPSPLPLLECAAKMNHVLAAGDWMVGDNWTDIDCAANAGIGSVFCEFGFGALGASTPTRRITSFSRLRDICLAPGRT